MNMHALKHAHTCLRVCVVCVYEYVSLYMYMGVCACVWMWMCVEVFITS